MEESKKKEGTQFEVKLVDIEVNLQHFKNISCNVNFTCPHDRKRIIKLANEQYKTAYSKFIDSVNQHLEVVQRLELYSCERQVLERNLRILTKEYFVLFTDVSPTLEHFSPSFHLIQQMMKENNFSFELSLYDRLSKKTTHWSNNGKLYAFLLARKRYFYECWKYLYSIKEYNWNYLYFARDNFYCNLSFNQIRELTLHLVSDNCIAKDEANPFLRVLFGVSNDRETNRFDAFRNAAGYVYDFPITWKQSTRLFSLLFFLLFKYDCLGYPSGYIESLISWKKLEGVFNSFINSKGSELSRAAIQNHFVKFRDDEKTYGKVLFLNLNEEKLNILIKNIKIEKRYK